MKIAQVRGYVALSFVLAMVACSADTASEPAMISFGGLDQSRESQTAAAPEPSNGTPSENPEWKLTAEQLVLSDNMELAPHRARLASGPSAPVAIDTSAEAGARAQARSDADETWRDATG